MPDTPRHIGPLERTILDLLCRLPLRWERLGVERLTATEQEALKRLTRGGLVEERIRLRAWMDGFPLTVLMQVCVSGEYQAADVIAQVFKAVPDWLDDSGRTRGRFRLESEGVVGVRLSDQGEEALACIRAYAREQPFPREWTDTEILQRLRQAERRCTRGEALQTDEGDLVHLGARDPATGRLVLSSRRTLPTAEAFVREFHAHPDGRTLLSYAGLLMEWRENRYTEVEDETLRQRLHPWLHEALRYVFNKATGEIELADFESNPGTVKAALDTLRAYAHLPASVAAPAWLDGDTSRPPASELLPGRSMVLHLPTMTSIEPTPQLFVTNALDFDYDPDAPPPRRWLEFLEQVLPDDPESVRLLQTWFGYVLTRPEGAAQRRQREPNRRGGPRDDQAQAGAGTRALARYGGTLRVVV